MRPLWILIADGEDVSAKLADYLVSLTVTDASGFESDELSLEVADPRSELAVPTLGARLSLALGYAHTGAVSLGEYVVDSVEIAHPPRRLSIRAHAADLRGDAKTRKTRDFEGKTLGEIVATLAAELGLVPAVARDLASVEVARIDQTNEGNLSFLTRLGQSYGAIATVKTGHLLLAKRGAATTVTGAPMTEIVLGQSDLTSWRVSLSETEQYQAVEARYYDRETAQEEWVASGDASGADAGTLRLRGTFPDRARAEAAAASKRGSLERGKTHLSLTLPGRTDIAAETPLRLTGITVELDGRWIVTRTTHSLGSGGYVLTLEGERESA